MVSESPDAAVSMMIGALTPLLRKRRQASRPSMSGRSTSSRIRSGRPSLACRMPSEALGAWAATNSSCNSSCSVSDSRMSGSSSTIRIVLRCAMSLNMHRPTPVRKGPSRLRLHYNARQAFAPMKRSIHPAPGEWGWDSVRAAHGLSKRPRAEERRADAHSGGAKADGGLEIRAHAHGETGEAVARGDLRQQREVGPGRLVFRRNAHQPLDLEAKGAAAQGDEGVGGARRHARLLRLLAGVDLDVEARGTFPPR